jgi:hypothetical protein
MTKLATSNKHVRQGRARLFDTLINAADLQSYLREVMELTQLAPLR